jgi:cytochrome c-type biogenesis protein CcmH
LTTRRLFFGAVLGVLVCGAAAHAVEPSERLSDPALEARARTLSQKLRCPVCQNQPIDESNADIAHDLRLAVRKRVLAGDTDQQVLDYMVARYGLYELLDPPFAPATYLLWLTPPLLVLGAGAFLMLRARQRLPDTEPPVLTEEERGRAALLLGDRG